MSASFTIRKKVDTFGRRIELAIPPENPQVTGHIDVDYRVRSKAEVKELSERGLTDEEYIREIVSGVRGLGNEAGEDISGDAAITEVLSGHFSMWLVPAIVSTYFEQYAEARRGNSKPRR